MPQMRVLGAPPPPRDLRELAEVASEQRCLVTRTQCVGAGMSAAAIRWRLDRGWWAAVHPGVYLTVPGRDDWWMNALAAQLYVGDAAWSHRTAAFVHGLLTQPPVPVDLLVSHSRRLVAPEGVLLHRREDADAHVDPLHWPWRTTVEETILDVSASGTLDETFALLGRGFQRRLTSEPVLRERLAMRARHPRRAVLDLVLADAGEGVESALEMRYLRDVERAHGLPVGVRQGSTEPGRRQRYDVGYLEQRVLVELDGRLGHEGPAARVQDGVRDRRSATTGWLTVRAFWRDVAGSPCDLAVDVAAVLHSRGWSGRVRACRRRGCAVRGAGFSGGLVL
jgi:hypothetical protein